MCSYLLIHALPASAQIIWVVASWEVAEPPLVDRQCTHDMVEWCFSCLSFTFLKLVFMAISHKSANYLGLSPIYCETTYLWCCCIRFLQRHVWSYFCDHIIQIQLSLCFYPISWFKINSNMTETLWVFVFVSSPPGLLIIWGHVQSVNNTL